MYSSVDQFLARGHAAFHAIFTEAAGEAGGYLAVMSPEQRAATLNQAVTGYVEALRRVHIDRATMRRLAEQPTDTGILADDVERLLALTEPRIEAYVAAELAAQPELRDELVRRSRVIHTSLRAALTTVRLDQILSAFAPVGADR